MRKESCGAEPEKGIPRSHLQLKLSSASPLREEFTLLPLAQASGRYERPVDGDPPKEDFPAAKHDNYARLDSKRRQSDPEPA